MQDISVKYQNDIYRNKKKYIISGCNKLKNMKFLNNLRRNLIKFSVIFSVVFVRNNII